MRSVVSVVRTKGFDQQEIKDAVYRSLNLLRFDMPKSAKSAAIKVNLRYYWDSTTGETTDPRLVSALIDYLRDYGDKAISIKIVEADASAMRANRAFGMLGYRKLAEEKSVELYNLSKDESIDKEVTVGGQRFKFTAPRTILSSDILVNAPKLKVHRLTTISCGLKNMFGCLEPRKVKYHKVLDETIVAVNKIIRPHLTVVDGIVALGKHPVKLGVLLAGEDILAVDFTAARLMGYDPKKIKHLRLALKERVGCAEKISIVGESVDELRKNFPTRSPMLFATWWNLQLFLLNLYTKLTGDVNPITD